MFSTFGNRARLLVGSSVDFENTNFLDNFFNFTGQMTNKIEDENFVAGVLSQTRVMVVVKCRLPTVKIMCVGR